MWLGGALARGGTRHTQHKPISIIINNKFLRPPGILRWGSSHWAKMDSQFLRNLISFIPLTEVANAHPSINYFHICWCHMIDETFSHQSIREKKYQIQKCQLFLDTRYNAMELHHLGRGLLRPAWIRHCAIKLWSGESVVSQLKKINSRYELCNFLEFIAIS